MKTSWCNKVILKYINLDCTFEGDDEDDEEMAADADWLLLAAEVGDLGFTEGAAMVATAGLVEALCDGRTIFRMSFFCFSASISSYLIGIEGDLNWFKQHSDEDMGRCF